MAFLDYFSSQSRDYAAFRPTYPRELFAWLGRECPGQRLAVDCATGNGQAAVGLADVFRCVIGVDPSGSQLSQRGSGESVHYVRATAESTAVRSCAADLVCVAQGFHWLEPGRFFAEAGRVLVPGGLVAVWGYGLPRISEAVDAVVDDHYSGVLGPYWAPQRRVVDDRYESIDFPLRERTFPGLSMTTTMSLEGLQGYVSSWSATRRYFDQHQRDPFVDRNPELEAAWSDNEPLVATWPLFGRVGSFD